MSELDTNTVLNDLLVISDEIQKNKFATTPDKSIAKLVGVLIQVVRDQQRQIDLLLEKK